MELTDIKEIKKLMKGDARRKFEFEEDAEVGSYDKGMLFTYSQHKLNGASKMKSGVTYSNTYAGQSHHMGMMANTYKDLSSDDSELQDCEEYVEQRKKAVQ